MCSVPNSISDQESIVRVPLTRVAAGEKQLISENFLLYKIFKTLFLPQGYPDSVSEDYIHYQLWDTIQAFCSTINGKFSKKRIFIQNMNFKHKTLAFVGTLSTHAILKGVGVGSDAANPLSATITWVSISFVNDMTIRTSINL